jgi:hypothetical protein
MVECNADIANHWATVIRVAMHFNEMLLSTRSTTATVMLALLGAAGLSVTHLDDKHAYFGRIHVGLLILGGGALFLLCIYLLDYHYYFRLLLSSVDVAERLEQQCPAQLPPLTIELAEHVPRDAARNYINFFYGIIAATMFALGLFIWHKKMPEHRKGTHNTKSKG